MGDQTHLTEKVPVLKIRTVPEMSPRRAAAVAHVAHAQTSPMTMKTSPKTMKTSPKRMKTSPKRMKTSPKRMKTSPRTMKTGKVKAMTIRTMKTSKVPKTTRTVKAVPMVRKSTTASAIHASGSRQTSTSKTHQKTPGGVRSRTNPRLRDTPRRTQHCLQPSVTGPSATKKALASGIPAYGSTKTLTGNNQKTPGGVRSRAEKRLQNGPRITHGNWALSATGPSQTSILNVARTKNGKKRKAQMHPSGTVQPTVKTIRAMSGPQKTVTRTGPQPT